MGNTGDRETLDYLKRATPSSQGVARLCICSQTESCAVCMRPPSSESMRAELQRLRAVHERLRRAILDEGCDCPCDCCWEDEDSHHLGSCTNLCTFCRLLAVLDGE